jgi:hypothetical protein
MTEVAVQNGTGQAAKLEELAEELNRQFVACGLALNSALDHALEVGRLLDEVKETLPHTEYTPWVVANFDGSDRTARDYRRLWVNREKVEAKRQSSAVLSIADALHFLKQLEPQRAPDPALGVPKPPPGAYPDPAVLRGWEEDQATLAAERSQKREALQRANVPDRALAQAKKGDPSQPASAKVVSVEEWDKVYASAVRWRTEEAGQKMVLLLNYLEPYIAHEQDGYRPEEAGAALLRINPQDRALTVLRGSIAWLQRVLEEAEPERARIQGGE